MAIADIPTEDEALSIYHRYSLLPPKERAFGRERLNAYVAARKQQGGPLWPAHENARAENNVKAVEEMWDNPDNSSDATWSRRIAYMAHATGASPNEVVGNMPNFRAHVAKRLGGDPSKIDDGTLDSLIRNDINARRTRRQLMWGTDGTDLKSKGVNSDSLVGFAAKSAQAGFPVHEAYAGWMDLHSENPEFAAMQNDGEGMFSQFAEVHQKEAAHWADLEGRAAKVLDVLVKQTDSKIPMLDTGAALDQLRGLSDMDRGHVLSLVSGKAKPVSKGTLDQSGEAIGRVFAKLVETDVDVNVKGALNAMSFKAGDPVNPDSANSPGRIVDMRLARMAGKATGLSGMEPGGGFAGALGESLFNTGKMTQEQANAANAEVMRRRESVTVASELRDIARGVVDPIKGSNWVSRNVYYPFLNIGSSLASFAMPQGWALNGVAYVNDEINRLDAQGVTGPGATLQALVVGSAQAAADKLQISIFGKLAATRSVLAGAAKPSSTLWGSLAGRALPALGTAAFETAIEVAQDTTPFWVQKTLAAIGVDEPSVSLDQIGKEAWATTSQTFFGMLPLALIGMGIGGHRDYKGTRSIVRDASALRHLGYGAESIRQIMDAPTIDESVAILRAGWESRTPVMSGEKGSAAAEASATMSSLEAGVGEKTAAAEWLARKEKIDGVVSLLAARGVKVSSAVKDGSKVWHVSSGGKVSEHSTPEDAYAVAASAYAHAGLEDASAAHTMLGKLAAITTAPAQGITVQGMGERRVGEFMSERAAVLANPDASEEERQSAQTDIEQMSRRIAEHLGVNPDADTDNLVIRGSSSLEKDADGTLRAVIHLADNANPDTAVEEKVEADAKALFAEGVTPQQLHDAIREIESATGDKYIGAHSGGADIAQDNLSIIEGWSRLAKVYLTARELDAGEIGATRAAWRKDVKRRLDEAEAKGLAPWIFERLRRIADWLRNVTDLAGRYSAARAKAAAEGKTFTAEQWLNRSFGITDDIAAVASVKEEAADIYPEGTTGTTHSIEEIAPGYEEVMSKYEGWNSIDVHKGRVFSPIVRDLLRRRKAGEVISPQVLETAIKEHFPSKRVPVPASMADIPSQATVLGAIRKDKLAAHEKATDPVSGILPVPAGTSVTVRQDVPAMTDHGVGVVTVVVQNSDKSTSRMYLPAARLLNPKFKTNEKETLEIGLGKDKGPHIHIEGKWSEDQSMPHDLADWTQVGFNPDRHSVYYERGTERQVTGGSEIFQIGNTVFVKDAIFGRTHTPGVTYNIEPGEKPAGKRSAEELQAQVNAMTSDEVRAHFERTGLVADEKVAKLMGKFPSYLKGVISYVMDKRKALLKGAVTRRDVAKAYWITIASIGADAIGVWKVRQTAERLGIEFNPDKSWTSVGAEGQDKIRPEELAAWWLGTEMGKRALDAVENGVVDMDAWEQGMALRDSFGRNDARESMKVQGTATAPGAHVISINGKHLAVIAKENGAWSADIPTMDAVIELPDGVTEKQRVHTPRMFGQKPGHKGWGMRDIVAITNAVNETKGNPEQLEKVLTKVNGIGEGKKGFIGHLIGFGGWATIDAVELNVWTAGIGDTSRASEEQKLAAMIAKKASGTPATGGAMLQSIRDGIDRMWQLKRPGLNKDVAQAIIHHWIWDAAKGTATTHEGMYHAMKTFELSEALVAAPVVTLHDLVGKSVFPIIADRTAAGGVYRGIDSSEVAIPVEQHGGHFFPLMPHNVQAKIGWASQGKGVVSQKRKLAGAKVYGVVLSMEADSHQSNATLSEAIIATNLAYVRDGRIAGENLSKLDALIRSDASLKDFPGIASPDIVSYVSPNNKSFKSRDRLGEILASSGAAKLGAANVRNILRDMTEKEFLGDNWGDGSLVIEFDADADPVLLGKPTKEMVDGKMTDVDTVAHPSYSYGLKGRVIGKLPRTINYTAIWTDWLSQREAAHAIYLRHMEDETLLNPGLKRSEVSEIVKEKYGATDSRTANKRSFSMAKPTQVITKEIADSIPQTAYKAISSSKHAAMVDDFINNRWRDSKSPVSKGGVSPADFINSLASTQAKHALDEYTLESITKAIKEDGLVLYQLGNHDLFFGIKPGNPADGYGLDAAELGLSDSDVTLTLVLNNEPASKGMISAVMVKALEMGVTCLDCYAVQSERMPDGLLPTLYRQFGFEQVGPTVDFAEEYHLPPNKPKTHLADLKKFWKLNGWDERKGMPKLVVMKYTGTHDRSTILSTYLSTGSAGFLAQGASGANAGAADAAAKDAVAVPGPEGSGRDAGGGAGDQGAAVRRTDNTRALAGAAKEVRSLTKAERANLGLGTTNSLAPAERLDEVARQLELEMGRSPETRRQMVQAAQSRLKALKEKWIKGGIESRRTNSSLAKEAGMRQALAFDRELAAIGLSSRGAKDSINYQLWLRLNGSRDALLKSGLSDDEASALAMSSAGKWHGDIVAGVKRALRVAREESAEWRREAGAKRDEQWGDRAVLLRAMATLDAILAAFPPQVRARVGGWMSLAKKGGERSMAAEIISRIRRLDSVMERELKKVYSNRISRLITRGSAKITGGKPSGRIGYEAHRLFAAVARAWGMDRAAADTAIADAEKRLADPDISDIEAVDLFEQLQLLDTYGAPETRDAAHLAMALDELQEHYNTGRNKWRVIEEQRLAGIRSGINAVVSVLGSSTSGVQVRKDEATRVSGILRGGKYSLHSFAEVLEILLGKDNALAASWSRRARLAMSKKTDLMIAAQERWNEAMIAATGMRGRKARRMVWDMGKIRSIEVTLKPVRVETIRVPIDTLFDATSHAALGLTSAEVDELRQQFEALPDDSTVKHLEIERTTPLAEDRPKFSEAEAIYLTMLWGQSRYRKSMERHGYGGEAQEALEDGITPAGKALREFMRAEYASGYEPLANLFRSMFGIDLPMEENYAPASFYVSGDDQVTSPDGSNQQQQPGFRDTFLMNRREHSAEPIAENAFTKFFGHIKQHSHWLATAELARELVGVLRSAEVKKAVLSRHGGDMMNALNDWVTAIQGDGLQIEHNRLMQMILSAQAYTALAWKSITVIKQTLALLGSAFKIPPHQYLYGLGKLFAGQLEVGKMWRSATIQRRIKAGFAPEARAALSQAFGSKPRIDTDALQLGMEVLGYVDAFFTTGSAAIAFDYHYRKAIAAGVGESMAEAMAADAAADIVSRTAQPVETTDRSLLELRLGGVGKALFMFGSEARQKSSMWMIALSRVTTGKGDASDFQVLAISHLVMGSLMFAISGAWRDMRDDDDDDDDAAWEIEDYVANVAMGPLSGLPLVRDAVDSYNGETGPLMRFSGAAKAAWAIPGGPPKTEKEEVEWYERKILAVLQGLPVPGGAVTAVGANVADQAFRIADNLIQLDEETVIKIKRMQGKASREKDPEVKAAILAEIRRQQASLPDSAP